MGRGQLVTSASPAPRSPAGKSAAAIKTIATTRFLRTRFVDHQRTTIDVHAVEFANSLCRVVSWPEFDESETPRPARFPIGDNVCGDCPIALLAEQLQQAVISHAIREISYIEFCHKASFVLCSATMPNLDRDHDMTFVRFMHSLAHSRRITGQLGTRTKTLSRRCLI